MMYCFRRLHLGRHWAIAGVCIALALAMAGSAYAELQSVEVGGELRIRGRWYHNVWDARTARIPNASLRGRPLGPFGTTSIFKWDDDGTDWTRYETSVLLNVKADFTDDVSAFIEFYDFHVWGEDFRSNYVTGADFRAASGDDIEVNQAYIEMRDVYGYPVRVRVGRQNLKFGKGWLVTDMLTPSQYVSHDAIRLTYAQDDVTVDVFASKLGDAIALDDDIDFYGIYGTYTGIESLTLAAYWFFLRDGTGFDDTPGATNVQRFVQDLLDVNNYGHTNLHTVGLRANGKAGNFDYDLELAYQFGDADVHGAGFVPVGGTFGDDDAEYDNWGGDLVVGYTFADAPWTPRVFLQGVYFEGEDNRDRSFLEWLNPLYKPEASVSFNRLFSDKNYVPVINDNGWMSNFYMLLGGVTVKPTEKVTVYSALSRSWIDEPFDSPVLPGLPWWTKENSDDLGWEWATYVRYTYSKDLWFLLYYNHLFADDGLTDGGYSQFNGTQFHGGSSDDDADYVFWMAVLKF